MSFGTPNPVSAQQVRDQTGPTPGGIRPGRGRQPALAAVMILAFLAVIGAVLFLVQRENREIEVVQVTAATPVGNQVTSIAEVQVAANSGIPYVLWSQRDQLSGYVATVALVAGQPLLNSDVTQGSAMPKGDELVGVTVQPGDYPAGLAQGDQVTVRVVSSSSTGSTANPLAASPVLFTGATVADVIYAQGSDPTSATALVNLYLTVSQANALAEGRGSGTVMVSVDGSS